LSPHEALLPLKDFSSRGFPPLRAGASAILPSFFVNKWNRKDPTSKQSLFSHGGKIPRTAMPGRPRSLPPFNNKWLLLSFCLAEVGWKYSTTFANLSPNLRVELCYFGPRKRVFSSPGAVKFVHRADVLPPPDRVPAVFSCFLVRDRREVTSPLPLAIIPGVTDVNGPDSAS